MLFLVGDYMKKRIIIILIIMFTITGCNVKQETEKKENKHLNIELKDIDNNKTNYTFIYKNETYKAIYIKDTWKIIS